jgi:hypothetical protein
MNTKAVMAFFAVLLVCASCVPEPVPLPKRADDGTPNMSVADEIRQIEEQAKEEVRERIAEEEAAATPTPGPTQAPTAADLLKNQPQLTVTQQQETQKSSKALGLYPQYFLDGDRFKDNFVTVIGEEAPSSYVVATANLVARTPGDKPTGFSTLASEIKNIGNYNAIVVGNACNNPVIASLFNNPYPCDKAPLPDGKGLIRIYESANGNVALIAAGKSDAQVVAAVNAIGTDAFIAVQSNEICVLGKALLPC